MRKIVFISTASNISGATLSLLEIMKELKARGYECICVTAERGELENRLTVNGFKYYKARYSSWLCREGELDTITGKIKFFIKKILEAFSERVILTVLKKEKPDIVHINTGISPVGLKSAKKLGIPVVWHLREDPVKSWHRRPYNADYEKKCKQSADRLLAISKYIKSLNEPISPDNIMYMYDGVDIVGYNELRKDEPFSHDTAILSICGCTKEKNNEAAFRAMKHLIDNGTDIIHLNIYGIAEENRMAELHSFSQQLGLGDYISFCGRTENIGQKFAESDIVLVCTDAEGFGRVTVEAMATGALVIAADAAANSELVESNRGILFEPNNPESLANAISCALNNKVDSKQIAANGKAFVTGIFNISDYVDNLLKLYSDIIKENINH